MIRITLPRGTISGWSDAGRCKWSLSKGTERNIINIASKKLPWIAIATDYKPTHLHTPFLINFYQFWSYPIPLANKRLSTASCPLNATSCPLNATMQEKIPSVHLTPVTWLHPPLPPPPPPPPLSLNTILREGRGETQSGTETLAWSNTETRLLTHLGSCLSPMRGLKNPIRWADSETFGSKLMRV